MHAICPGREHLPCWLRFFCPCGVAIWLVVFGWISVIAVAYMEYFDLMWNQVTSLQALPEDIFCPMLWKDPLADYIF